MDRSRHYGTFNDLYTIVDTSNNNTKRHTQTHPERAQFNNEKTDFVQ